MQNSKIYRIIDVNINRAVEGLRVVEEICRFVLENRGFTKEFKEMRSRLRKLIDNDYYYQQRKALEDVGKSLYTASEAARENLLDIFVSNTKRAQEALRVLEEFIKLIDPRKGKILKNTRFKLYALEKNVYDALNKKIKLDFDLYVVTDPSKGHLAVARRAVARGVKIVQLRDKKASKVKVLKWAKQIQKLTRKAGIAFIVNDYVDIAGKSNADGVHVGQDDLTVKQARKKLGEGKIVGVSTHNLVQALKAEKDGADYIAVGPIFLTPTKPDAKPVGLRLLKKVVKRVKIPVVAIGGINESNLEAVRRTGCQRVAVVRAFC